MLPDFNGSRTFDVAETEDIEKALVAVKQTLLYWIVSIHKIAAHPLQFLSVIKALIIQNMNFYDSFLKGCRSSAIHNSEKWHKNSNEHENWSHWRACEVRLDYSAIIYSHLLLRSLLGGGMPAIFIQGKDGCLKLAVETRHAENTKQA